MKRKLLNRSIGLTASTVAFGLLTACGGGGTDLGVADGGIRGTGSSVGPVSGFGSVFVNGVRFDTSEIPNRTVISDDGITSEDLLSEGMILRVEGQWLDTNEGTADSLEYDDTLRGPLTALEPDPSGAGEFVTATVLDQSVRVDRQTVVRGTTFASLLAQQDVGQTLRISAWQQPDGSYRAGYLAVIAEDLNDVELEGRVSDVDIDLNQFRIGSILVEYDDGSVIFGSGLTEADLQSAESLEVEGSLSGLTLTARSIDRDDTRRYEGTDGEDIELTNVVLSGFVPAGIDSQSGTFTMAGRTVFVDDQTELDDGLTVGDLQPGLLIQVEGALSDTGNVLATEIELRDANGEVKGVMTPGSLSTAVQTLRIGGVLVQATSRTIVTLEEGDQRIRFDQIPEERMLEVKGIDRLSGDLNYLEALKIEVDNENADLADRTLFELEGQVRDMSSIPSFIEVLGIRIGDVGLVYDSDRGTIYSDFSAGEAVFVEVEYTSAASGQPPYTADEIELESEDNDN
ncbi:hypothetical protein GCM10009113_12160 [Marinobacter szutsaonensis]